MNLVFKKNKHMYETLGCTVNISKVIGTASKVRYYPRNNKLTGTFFPLLDKLGY